MNTPMELFGKIFSNKCKALCQLLHGSYYRGHFPFNEVQRLFGANRTNAMNDFTSIDYIKWRITTHS